MLHLYKDCIQSGKLKFIFYHYKHSDNYLNRIFYFFNRFSATDEKNSMFWMLFFKIPVEKEFSGLLLFIFCLNVYICKKNITMGVGTNLKRLRSKTKFSQQEIADMLGLDRNTYTNWENETTDIKSSYIPKLAEIFQVSILDLFNESQKNTTYNNLENFALKDNAVGQKDIQQGIIINITDSEAAK